MGRLPTAGEALGAMLDHALSSWGALDRKVPARHRVFDRDGWRCAAPGCTSMQNLHDHHIRFRSAGGSDAPENRVTLCAFHHLRGVHAARLRCVGQAPDGLTWQMGIRPGAAPLVAYRSGDLQVTDSWKVPATDEGDYDFGSTPTLFSGTVTPGGSRRQLLGIPNKNGNYYVFDRARIASGPVATIVLAHAPRTDPTKGNGSISPSAFDGHTLYIAGGYR